MKFNNRLLKLEKDDYYYSNEGYIVFTEKYHLKRGHCCDSNCKHCPFKNNNVTKNRKIDKNDWF